MFFVEKPFGLDEKKEAETFNVDVGKVLAEIDDVKAGISRAISEIDVIIMKCEESEQ